MDHGTGLEVEAELKYSQQMELVEQDNGQPLYVTATTETADNLDYSSVFLDEIVDPYLVDTTFDIFVRGM
jgi:hypothetical protein